MCMLAVFKNMFTRGDIMRCIGVDDVLNLNILWRQLLAEFFGTMFIVLIGCGSTIEWSNEHKPTILQVALAFGLIVACVVQVAGPVSGAHVNPAVTVGLLAAGYGYLLRALLYVAVQCAGAVAGAAVLQVVTPAPLCGALGATSPGVGVALHQAFAIEALATFVLVSTVFRTCCTGRLDTLVGAPFAVGLCVTACHLFAMPYTGASMNPARSIGPAAVTANWTHQWLYWVAPMLGAILAGCVSRWCLEEAQSEL